MDQQQAAEVLRNLDVRTKRMEQILPDLPTRQEMEAIDSSIQAAVGPLATRQEMHDAIQAAVAPLATREELRQGLSDLRDELRHHMDVWAERIYGTSKLAFESIEMVDEKHGRSYEEVRQRLVDLIKTEAQHHVGPRKTYEELVEYWRDYVKAHAREHAEARKAIEKVRGRVEKIEAKQARKRKAS